MEIESLDQAKKVEETVKTGFTEPMIESLIQWIAVEEDLESSYEHLEKARSKKEQRDAAGVLHRESKRSIAQLGELLKTIEGLDGARKRRIGMASKEA